MIKPDLIVAWPIAFDYPAFRSFVVSNRKMFDKIIVTFTFNSSLYDFRDKLKEIHPDFTFVEGEQGSDWYNPAVNAAIDASVNEWIMFMEQDFICDTSFIKELFSEAEKYDFISYAEGQRYHFCCSLMRRLCVDNSSRFFGIKPGSNLDNFDAFINECKGKFRHTTTNEVLVNTGYHMNGLTHNYSLCLSGKLDLITNPRKFFEYNDISLSSKVDQIPEWVGVMEKVRELRKY